MLRLNFVWKVTVMEKMMMVTMKKMKMVTMMMTMPVMTAL